MSNKPLKAIRTFFALAIVLGTAAACSNVVPPPAANLPQMQGPWPAYMYPQNEGGG